ncbi:ribonuclease E inhibitor RraB [Phycicoccus sp. BSK3Z-2]|uniref:Ribonuclease E inhibitor RraB n=1 Tax=Phycicoccus avicenniae TaxID=2828860 RepID=A0A941DBY4_9MICO|nr:ribonuclease E inhibitor RraB [Phycicoccus avicenniae]MBR7744630.1 ribonuclease E inhibitor RraB [Phycicoccus avicenniae]
MTEHLLVFPDRDVAEQVADELRDEGFTEVRVVREALSGEDDAEDHEWAVHVVVEGDRDIPDLRERLSALAQERDGWYDPTPLG